VLAAAAVRMLAPYVANHVYNTPDTLKAGCKRGGGVQRDAATCHVIDNESYL
jgi:hypothetical protein